MPKVLNLVEVRSIKIEGLNVVVPYLEESIALIRLLSIFVKTNPVQLRLELLADETRNNSTCM